MRSLRVATLVKFQARWMKKRYKNKKEYRYKRYSLGFPARLNEKIEPHTNKDFEIDDFTHKETVEQEIINIILRRNKSQLNKN
jgi:hypothetical protein